MYTVASLVETLQHVTKVFANWIEWLHHQDLYTLATVHAWMCKYTFENSHRFLSTWGVVSLKTLLYKS